MKSWLFYSERLQFEPLKESDLFDTITLLGNNDVCRFLPGETGFHPEKVTRWLHAQMERFSEQTPSMIFSFREKDQPEMIGYVGIGLVKELNQPEILYALHPKYWGRGYATEAANRMVDLAKELKIHHLIALADVRNYPSQKVLEKIGYRQANTITLWGLNLYYYELDL